MKKSNKFIKYQKSPYDLIYGKDCLYFLYGCLNSYHQYCRELSYWIVEIRIVKSVFVCSWASTQVWVLRPFCRSDLSLYIVFFFVEKSYILDMLPRKREWGLTLSPAMFRFSHSRTSLAVLRLMRSWIVGCIYLLYCCPPLQHSCPRARCTRLLLPLPIRGPSNCILTWQHSRCIYRELASTRSRDLPLGT